MWQPYQLDNCRHPPASWNVPSLASPHWLGTMTRRQVLLRNHLKQIVIPHWPCLQNQQFLRRSFPDRGERNTGIESNEPSIMLNRESKQVYVGQLPRSMNSGRIHDIRIQQTDFIRPEFMDILAAGLG